MNANDLNGPVIGFNHVNLHVDDLPAAQQFYGHGLGLVELDRPGGIGTGLWYAVGSLQLHLSLVTAMPPGSEAATTHIALQLPADSFDDCVNAIEARGVTLSRRPQSREQLGVTVRSAFCRDPANNLIELTDVGPLD